MNITPVDLFESHREQFQKYQDLLLKWNRKINLTAITKPDEVKELHFIDSLFVLHALAGKNVSRETFLPSTSILDIGAGAGFPGLPLKIAFPKIRLTLVEAVKKKCDFMKEIVRSLNLKEVQVVHRHLEPDESIGQFEIVVSRATLKMDRLIRLGLPNLKPDGIVIGMKGSQVSAEIAACENLFKKYRLGPLREIDYSLPFTGHRRILLIMGLD